MSKTKKVTISLTPEQQDKARTLSKKVLGKENISGWIQILIEAEFKKAVAYCEAKQINLETKNYGIN